MDCPVCKHAEHRAGMCENCNCGESEIISNTQPAIYLDEDDWDFFLSKIYEERSEEVF